MTGFIALFVFVLVAGAMLYMSLRKRPTSTGPKAGGGSLDENPKHPPMAE